MSRYIFQFRGHVDVDGNDHNDICTPEDKLNEAIKGTDATVVDKASSKMVLVEADASALAELRRTLPDWSITPERSVPLPDTRKRIRD